MINLEGDSAVPKYRQLAERIREQMKNGALRPGDRLPTLNEMRDDHRISRPTVEKAYALLERDGLIQRLHGAGVFVTEPRLQKPRRRLSRRPRRKGIVGLSGAGFGASSHSTYWSHLMGGARDAASRADLQLLLLDPAKSQGWEKVDGVLVCDWNDSRVPRRDVPGLPLVSLLTPIPGIASAVADDHAGMRMAIKHLFSLGHQRIGYLHSHTDHEVTRTRMASYRGALAAAGIEPAENWMHLLGGRYFVGAQFSVEAHTDMRRWLDRDWDQTGCTALLCHNDETAVGAIQAFTEAGYRVPKDVSVMGFDGTEFCDLVSPRLSSIRVPLREIGRTGVELLLQQIEADAVNDEHRVLQPQLLERASTAACGA